MSLKAWEHFFKPEIRSSAKALAGKDKLSQSSPSDTEVQTFIRASGGVKVVLKSPSVSSPKVIADCSCSQFKKGQFCKHLWAALLVCEKEHPDFLDEKSELQIKAHFKEEPIKKSAQSQKRDEFQASYKAKQADYRKQQYQKQKQRLKDIKNSKKNAVTETQYPQSVEKALNYFASNGFSLRETMTTEAIVLAKKKLARIFHPDVGGTHDEIVELNANAEILLKFAT